MTTNDANANANANASSTADSYMDYIDAALRGDTEGLATWVDEHVQSPQAAVKLLGTLLQVILGLGEGKDRSQPAHLVASAELLEGGDSAQLATTIELLGEAGRHLLEDDATATSATLADIAHDPQLTAYALHIVTTSVLDTLHELGYLEAGDTDD